MKQDRAHLHNLSKKNLGLTLIELLITLVVMALIMGGLVSAFISHSRISATEEARMEVQQNLRVSVDRLKHVLRHAGFGCYDVIGSDSKIGDYDNFISNVDTNSMTMIYAFRKIAETAPLNENCNLSNGDVLCNIKCNDEFINLINVKTPNITKDNEYTRYLSFFPDLSGNYFYYVDEPGNPIKIDKNIDFITCSDVFMVTPAIIVVEDNVLKNKKLSYQHLTSPDQHWAIAENIQDIYFQYYENGNWHDNETTIGELQGIRKIRFWILGRSKNPVPNVGQQEFQLKDSDGEVVYEVGPFNDGRLRMLSRGEVTLRNVF